MVQRSDWVCREAVRRWFSGVRREGTWGVVLVKIIGLDVAHRHTNPPGDIHGRPDHFSHNAPGFFGGLRPAHARDVVDVDRRAIRQSHIPAVQTNERRALHWQREDVLCVAGFVYGVGRGNGES